jgi:hypothetical protein
MLLNFGLAACPLSGTGEAGYLVYAVHALLVGLGREWPVG